MYIYTINYYICSYFIYWLSIAIDSRLSIAISLLTTGCQKPLPKRKHSKIFFSEAIWGMKLKLCINVYDISLYIKCVFIAVAHVFSLLWQLKSFHRFIMGKVKVGLYFYLTRYFDKSFTVMFLEHINLVQTAEFD